jgi:uncharacterized protein YecT (DUF1311 family)
LLARQPIQQAQTRFTHVLSSRGVVEAASEVATSQDAWERYRSTHCQLHEQLSGGGSIARISIAHCRRDLANARLAELQALERTVIE